MAKLGFTIKIASKSKNILESKPIKIGKRCQAVVIDDNGKLKARLITSPVEGNDELSEFRVINFTNNSFNIKNKTHIFLNKKDKYNHYICIIRDGLFRNIRGVVHNKCHTLHENLVIEGHILKKDNIYYFDYENLISYKEGGGLLKQ